MWRRRRRKRRRREKKVAEPALKPEHEEPGHKPAESVDEAVNQAAKIIKENLGMGIRLDDAPTLREKIFRLGEIDSHFMDEVYNKHPGKFETNETFRALSNTYNNAMDDLEIGIITPQKAIDRLDSRMEHLKRTAALLDEVGEKKLAKVYRYGGMAIVDAAKKEILEGKK